MKKEEINYEEYYKELRESLWFWHTSCIETIHFKHWQIVLFFGVLAFVGLSLLVPPNNIFSYIFAIPIIALSSFVFLVFIYEYIGSFHTKRYLEYADNSLAWRSYALKSKKTSKELRKLLLKEKPPTDEELKKVYI